MHKLVIFCKYDGKAGMPDTEYRMPTDFESSTQAELRGLLWLLYCPDDLVMLVEVESGSCRHCGEHIEEDPGWVLHKFKHVKTKARLCYGQTTTVAELA